MLHKVIPMATKKDTKQEEVQKLSIAEVMAKVFDRHPTDAPKPKWIADQDKPYFLLQRFTMEQLVEIYQTYFGKTMPIWGTIPQAPTGIGAIFFKQKQTQSSQRIQLINMLADQMTFEVIKAFAVAKGIPNDDINL